MRITLVNPPPEIAVEFWDTPKHPNLSLGYLAGFLVSEDVDCRVIDAKLERLDASEVVKRCVGEDLVGFTALTHEITYAAKIAKRIKKASPKTRIVLGGAHATALPEETLEAFPSFDYLVYGEGEHTLYELLEAIENNKSLSGIHGLVFREDEKIIINPPRVGEQELDLLPFPAWQLFPKAEEYFVMSARGCPFGCIFCMRLHGQKVRARSVENVLDELQIISDKYHGKYVYFADETFTLFKDRTIKICEGMIKRGIHKKLRWDAETRVNCVDFKVLKKMKDAGCVLVRFGIEAGNPAILRSTKKGITIPEVERAIKLAKKAGLKTQGLFILGHPNETKETMKETIDLAVRLNTSMVAFGIMTPYPGTEVYELAKKGLGGYKIISSDWKDFNKQIGNALELKNVSRKEMERLQFWGYMRFYFFNFKFGEILKNIYYNHRLAVAMLRNVFRGK
jgi:radical SAM superfamily enzyme YgiQ (UPF0313 family)